MVWAEAFIISSAMSVIMAKSFVVFALLVLSIPLFAQGAAQYCSSERAQGEACYKQCCESMGYSWSGGGCAVSGAQQDSVTQQCGYCTDSYMQCVAQYQSGGSSGASGSNSTSASGSGAGCCSSFILLSLLGFAVAYARR